MIDQERFLKQLNSRVSQLLEDEKNAFVELGRIIGKREELETLILAIKSGEAGGEEPPVLILPADAEIIPLEDEKKS
jgi:hypothetical protein